MNFDKKLSTKPKASGFFPISQRKYLEKMYKIAYEFSWKADAVVKVGTTHRDEVDKFAEAALTPMDSKVIKAPLIAECFLNIECKVIHQYVTGDHTLFVDEPAVVHMNDDLFADGKFSEKYRNDSSFIHYEDVMGSLC